MLVQRVLMESFQAAIAAGVRPGTRVLKVGTGLAIYSMFAAKAGARRVWAVEGGPILPIARQVVRDNGFAHVIELLEGWYPEVTPPDLVDVVLYEDHGSRLFDARSWAVLDHVARAGLAPGGVIIPGRARIWIAPAHSPRNLEVVAPFSGAVD